MITSERKNKLLLMVFLAFLLYISFIIYSDLEKVMWAFHGFNWSFLPLILSLVITGYLLRGTRWYYYLRRININISIRDSYLIFFGGQSMTITPGKIGEMIKPYLVKNKTGTEVGITVPVVFVERLTDLIGMVILASFGSLSFHYGIKPLLITLILIALGILIIQCRSVNFRILKIVERIPRLGLYAENFKTVYNATYILLRPKSLGIATLISCCAWGLECISTYLVFSGIDVNIGILESTFIFAFSSVVGTLTMLPGGLGATEGSMVGISMILGVEISKATTATLLVRFLTLWFGVIIGLVILQYIFHEDQDRVISNNKNNEQVR
ncbi:MAG TPA: flippase-like domain-containing protein [Thermoplasmatales archaeon]|nr:flippase-like domain-containing protein [Thermoplasmatales archaeon]